MVQKEDSLKFHELVIPKPLWDFLTFCEVYCSASCCEDSAFEQHHSLIRRKIININIESSDGQEQFRKACKQLQEVTSDVKCMKPETDHDQVLVWVDTKEGSHEFQMNLDTAPEWFAKWEEVFEEIAKPKTYPNPME